MATKVGYLGVTGYRGGLGWWVSDWAAGIAKSVPSSYSGEHNAEYRTPNTGCLTLDANEYPTAIQFSEYDDDGFICAHDDMESDDPGSVAAYLCTDNKGSSRQFTTLRIARSSSSRPTTNFSVPNGRDLAGKALWLRCAGTRGIWFNGRCKVTITTLVHGISWSGGGLSFSQSRNTLTITRSGSATDNWGETVNYDLYRDGSYVGRFSGTSMTLTLSDYNYHTYQLYAVSSISALGANVGFTPTAHTLNWTGAGIAVSQNEYQITVTKSGYATDSWGDAVHYDLYIDGAYKGTFSGNSYTYTITDADTERAFTYKVVAVSTLTRDGASTSYTTLSVHKTLGYHDGTRFVVCIPYVWDGSSWVEVEPYYWDGTRWVLCSQT